MSAHRYVFRGPDCGGGRAFAEAEARVAGRRTSARLSGGARALVTYAGGERVVVRRGGASTAPQHEGGSDDGDTADMGV